MTLYAKWVFPLIVVGFAMRLAVVLDPPCDRYERYAPQRHQAAAVHML